MIRDAHEQNEITNPNDFEVERLKATLPEYFDKDGNFMMDKFENSLREIEVSLTKEGHELKFLGKSYAKYLTSTATETVITPDLEHNAQPENKDSENLYIVGDNLDALKHLRGSYSGKVKCIYIDPPYNTGSDGFVYNDDFGFTSEQLVEKIGISEDEADRTLDMRGKSSHSAWMTFMYPRLQLAMELLSNDGVLFISIDENEIANLTQMGKEIFGEQNHVSTLIWQKKKGGGNDSVHVAVEHEYVALFSRDINHLDPLFIPYSDDYLKRYKEEDERGLFYWDTFKRKSGKQYYPITAPDGTVLEFEADGSRISWLRSEKTFYENLRDGEVRFMQKSPGDWSIHFKQRIPAGKKPRSLLKDVGTTSTGGEDVEALFGAVVFDNPKPVALVKELISFVVKADDIVLDFFSGSGTTAQSVMSLNSKLSEKVKFILVQLNEELDESKKTLATKNAWSKGYRTIDELGRERIKLASAKIKEETRAEIDYGFKLFRLTEPDGETLDQLYEFDPKQEQLFPENYVSKFDQVSTPGRDTVLATWLAKDGYGLTAKTSKVKLSQYEIDVVSDTAYIIEPGLKSKDVFEFVRKLEMNDDDLAGVNRIVVLGYSVSFSVMHELKKNLSVLKSGRSVTVIERL
ncbi:site-specific DNA-methyltransferase [Corynebacterium callunae]|uniref:site-specific DNA-methyltransferase n=1 Tax=Corynebacterium callunae TaxID=1721 RepID=UPI001FFF6DE7|nr:site-specific DNA-methyltransferase [Corynebacterium callunae]MCK2200570.1 site-specific DNA-methyltransferase [Corynebacterium callunae]